MEYGRVVNLEFKSKEDLVSFRNKWTEWWPNNVPAVISRKSIKTSETSVLLMATYETEEIADKAKEVVEKFLNWQPSIYMTYSLSMVKYWTMRLEQL